MHPNWALSVVARPGGFIFSDSVLMVPDLAWHLMHVQAPSRAPQMPPAFSLKPQRAGRVRAAARPRAGEGWSYPLCQAKESQRR
jgi:hypothetical protein